jgi:hypothetical protein
MGERMRRFGPRAGAARLSAVLLVALVCLTAWTVSAQADESTDVLRGWTPPVADGPAWTPLGEDLQGAPQLDSCEEESVRAWERPGWGYVALVWNECGGPELAAQLTHVRETRTPADEAVGGGALRGGHDRVRTVLNGEGVMRYWGEGSVHVSVVLGCAGPVDEVCRQESAALAQELSDLLPGDPLAGRPIPDSSPFTTVFVLPFGFWAFLFGIPRLLFSLRDPRYPSVPAPAYEDLRKRIRTLRLRRAARRLCVALAVIGVFLGTAWLAFGGPVAGVFWLAIATAGVWGRVKIRDPLLRRPGPRAPTGRGKRFAAAAFGAISAGLILLLCALWVPFAAVSDFARIVPDWASYLDPSVERIPLVIPFLTFVQVTRGSPELFFVMVVIPAGLLAFVAHRLAQRFASLTAAEVLAADPRPFFLYLRSFDEDRLKTKVSLGRTGLLARMAPIRRRRFEEVLVRALSRYGPVVAISPPGQRLSPLGAARASLDHESWQGKVLEWAGQARAVVLSGTPTEVRQGFSWEIETLSQGIDHRRVMVVCAPWRPAEFRRRLGGFLAHAARWPLFAHLPWIAQDGLHVATFSDQRGWRLYGAPRRSDWSYTVCIDAAMADVLPAWDSPGGPTPPRTFSAEAAGSAA